MCSSLTLTLTILSYPSPHVACLSPMSGKGLRIRGKLSGALLFASCHFKVTNMEMSWNFVAWDICLHLWVNFQETDRLLGQQYNDDTGYYDTVKVRIAKKFTSSFWLAAIVSRGPENGMIWRVGECNHGPAPAFCCLLYYVCQPSG